MIPFRLVCCFFPSFLLLLLSIFGTITANSSPKMFAFSTKQKRIRGLSIMEQTELKDTPWFQIGVPREISLEVLRRKNPGEFLVRESHTKPGCFALSLRAPPPAPKVVHYLILRTPRGYKIKVSFTFTAPINSHLPDTMQMQMQCNKKQPSKFIVMKFNCIIDLNKFYYYYHCHYNLVVVVVVVFIWNSSMILCGIASVFI